MLNDAICKLLWGYFVSVCSSSPVMPGMTYGVVGMALKFVLYIADDFAVEEVDDALCACGVLL